MDTRKQLIDETKLVFGSVTFPAHQGIRAAMAADDWISDPEKLAQITAEKDIHGEWWEIPEEELQYCTLGLCYLDSAGIEFYLPAYITMALKNLRYIDYIHVIDHLDPDLDGDYTYFYQRFEKIQGEKKRICIRFLEYLLLNLDPSGYHEKSVRDDIKKILQYSFWKQ